MRDDKNLKKSFCLGLNPYYLLYFYNFYDAETGGVCIVQKLSHFYAFAVC